MAGCEASKQMLLGIMLLSIISVTLGAGSAPGDSGACQGRAATLPRDAAPSPTGKPQPPHSPKGLPLDVYSSAVIVAIFKNTSTGSLVQLRGECSIWRINPSSLIILESTQKKKKPMWENLKSAQYCLQQHRFMSSVSFRLEEELYW